MPIKRSLSSDAGELWLTTVAPEAVFQLPY